MKQRRQRGVALGLSRASSSLVVFRFLDALTFEGRFAMPDCRTNLISINREPVRRQGAVLVNTNAAKASADINPDCNLV